MAAKAIRHDPKPRHTDGVGPGPKLRNADPNRAYVFVNRYQGGVFDTGYYEALGEWAIEQGLAAEGDRYRVEISGAADAPQLSIGKTARTGEPIEYRGMVLMRCAKSFKALIEECGAEGDAGQREADRVEELIQRKGRVADNLSGIGSTNARSGQPDIYLQKNPEEGRMSTYG